jgi:hypothetical protein
MKFLSEQISDTRERTSQGFLVLRDVPIARTGVMLYAGSEVPITPGGDGIVRIEREPGVVFAPETIASFHGAPVTLEHPSEDVDPSNWKQLAVGLLFDVRRGTGIQDDLLIADVLITDATAIEGIDAGKYQQVSAGYDAAYVEDGPGKGRQTAIVGNHLALLSGDGRCGPVCSIGDKATVENRMNKFFDRIRKAFQARDEKAFEAVLDEAQAEETKPENEEEKREEVKDSDEPTLADLCARIEALEAVLKSKVEDEDKSDEKEKEKAEEEKKEEKTSDEESDPDDSDKDDEDGDGEDADASDKKSHDAASIQVHIQEIVSRAEILAPGLKLTTIDANADQKKVNDSLCALKRKALIAAINGKSRDAIRPLVSSAEAVRSMDCATLQATFIGASEILKRTNNVQPVVVRDGNQRATDVASKVAAINKRNAEFWARTK